MARALRVDKEVAIAADAARVFSALVKGSELEKWFADRVSGDAREGELIEFAWGSGPTVRRSRARVLRIEPGAGVMMRWEDAAVHSRDDYFSLRVEEGKGTTTVRVVDFATRDTAGELDEIWDQCLAKLKAALEAGARSKPKASAKAAAKAAPKAKAKAKPASKAKAAAPPKPARKA